MAIDSFGVDASTEQIEKHGKHLISEYGIDACEAAARIEETSVSKSTANSYKPQVRQVLSECEDMNPTPRMVADVISDVDKKGSTKSLMISAMDLYFTIIECPEKGDKLRDIAKIEGIAKKNFDDEREIEGWITKEEMERIEEHIFPDAGERIKQLSFSDKSWAISSEHKALCQTLFYTACRVGEVCKRDKNDVALSVEDLDFESNQINLYRLKKSGEGYKRDMTVVPEILMDALSDYMELNNIEEGHLFAFTTRTAQNRVEDVHKTYTHAFGEFENIDKLTPKMLRNYRVSESLN